MADDYSKFVTDEAPPLAPGTAGPPAIVPERPADPAYAKFEQVSEPTGPGLLESFGRGTLAGGVAGFEDELGLASRERQTAAREANPWTYFFGEMGGTIVPMVATGGAGALARGAGLGARAVRAVAGAFTPGPMNTVRQAATQGAKLGATYGTLSGAGHSEGETLLERGADALKGGAAGTVLGAPIGAAGYGASRAVGAVLNRVLPELSQVRAAAKAPELQGIRDALREMGYDRYTIDDLARLKTNLSDPAQAARYEGLNLIEALEARPVAPHPATGEPRPPIVTSPNLRSWAQDVANTPGAGRHQAVEAYATRRAEMPAALQGDVNRLFGQALRPRAADDEALPALIDAAFGSGSPEAAATAQAARKGALGRRYDRMRDQPLVLSESIGPQIQALPVFQRAMDYAAQNDAIRMPASSIDDLGLWVRNAATGFMERAPPGGQVSGVPGQLWSKNTIGVNSLTLSPNNILDIHHALVMNAKIPPTGVATPETVMAGKLKAWWSAWADKQLGGHKGLRTEYARFKQMMEAQDLAATLPLNRGGPDHQALQFLNRVGQSREEVGRRLQQHIAQYDAAMARFQAGQIKTQPKPTNLNKGILEIEGYDDILGAFRRSWGESIKAEMARTGDVNSIVRPALTPEGQRRILAILGPADGRQFIGQLMHYEARNQGMALGLSAGGADNAALRFFHNALRDGRTDVADTFRRAWGERINQEISTATNDNIGAIVRNLLTQEGKRRITTVLGRDRGMEFIESLYNKRRQMDLGQTLFGGPDTAYKLQRMGKQKALMDAAHGMMTLSPGRTYGALRELGSAAWQQRRADLSNQLLAVQGRPEVSRVIDAILARHQLARTGHPLTVTPGKWAIGPYAEAQVGDLTSRGQPRPYDRQQPPLMLPYRP
jgi:hypothetical protein